MAEELWLFTSDGENYRWAIKQDDGWWLPVDDDYVFGPSAPKEKVAQFQKWPNPGPSRKSTRRQP